MNENDELLSALWRKADATWEDSGVHRALLEAADTPSRLHELAARYRAETANRARIARAERQLRALAVLALARLTPEERPATPGRGLGLALVIFFVCGTVAVAFLLWRS